MERRGPPRWLPKIGLVGRAVSPQADAALYIRPEVMEPRTDIALIELYRMARKCNAVRKAITSLRDHIFLNGIEWEAAFSKKCGNCAYEFDPEASPDNCKKCGQTNLVEPDESEIDRAEEFFQSVDLNGHSFIEALKMHRDHLSISDNGYLVARMDYEIAADDGGDPATKVTWRRGDILSRKVVELLVANPLTFRPIADRQTNIPGGRFWVCLAANHRYVTYVDPETRQKQQRGTLYEHPGTCRERDCGLPLHDVWYVTLTPSYAGSGSGPVAGDVLEAFLKDEVSWVSEYSIGYGLGYPPMESIFNLADTLVAMERFMKAYYDEMRMPRSAGFIPTRNSAKVEEVFKDAEDKNVAQRGQHFPIFTFDPGESRVPIQVLELAKLPAEMQYLEFMDFCYRRIGMAFDVTPVMQGEMAAGGLQNQGPLQWEVSNLGARKAQAIYNNRIFPWLLKLLGVKDWKLKLKEPQDRDEMKHWNTETAKLNYAMGMQSLGFQILGRNPDGSFEYSSVPRAQMGMGMGMGFPGAGPPGGGGGAGFEPPPPGSTVSQGTGGDEGVGDVGASTI